MSTKERLIFTLRPNGLPLWLPELLAQDLRIAERSQLTAAQYNSLEIQELIKRRLQAEGAK